MDYETLDSIALTTKPKRDLEKAGGTLAMGIISIPFCLGILGIIFAIAALIRSAKAISEFKKNPLLYTEKSYNKMKAARICAIVSLSLLGVTVLLLMALS